MAIILGHTVEPPGPCSYLPDQLSSLEQLVMQDVTAEEYERMLVRGWRRFGPLYFRPACQACNRVRLAAHPHGHLPAQPQPAPGPRRVRPLARGGGPAPGGRAAAGALPRLARRARADARVGRLAARRCATTSSSSPSPTRPRARWRATTTPPRAGRGWWAWASATRRPTPGARCTSSTIPPTRSCSPGTANVVFQVELARARGIPHVYLGYRVQGCASLRYKGTFRPHELLEGRPAPEETPRLASRRSDSEEPQP